MAEQVYRPRRPRDSPLWQCLQAHSSSFLHVYPEQYEKKVQLFGEFITGTISFPVPHRQYVFSLPIMLRVYFRNNRELLKQFCRIANDCLLEFLRRSLNRPGG